MERGACRLYGYEAGEVIGKANSEIFHTPEDIALGKHREMMDIALRDGKWSGLVKRVGKGGRRFLARVAATPPQQGRKARRLSSHFERHFGRNQCALGREVPRAERVADAMVIANEAGRIVVFNSKAERLFGYSREEVTGQLVEILVPERFRGNDPARQDNFFENSANGQWGRLRALFALRKRRLRILSRDPSHIAGDRQ